MSEDKRQMVSPLRLRMIEDMRMRKLERKTQEMYIRGVCRLAKYLGRSPQCEIHAFRLKRVKQLLGDTDLTLSRIADLVGYDHAEYMSVVFRRETGQTPGQYRRQVQLSKPQRR